MWPPRGGDCKRDLVFREDEWILILPGRGFLGAIVGFCADLLSVGR